MDRHLVASLAIAGLGCDALGGFYLAYDLLGGSEGPLSTVSEAVTYAALFTTAYCLLLGMKFGLVAGLGLGVVLGVEYRNAAGVDRGDRARLRRRGLAFAAARGLALGAAATASNGLKFGLHFAVLSAIGLACVNLLGYSPTDTFERRSWPRLSKTVVAASLLRAAMIAGAATLAARWTNTAPFAFGMKLGATVGVASVLLGVASPPIAWRIEHLPPRMLGAVGGFLVVLGFSLQSAQYFVVLLDLPVQ